MTIKPLYPAIRPSLDLNFALTKRLDPRVSYTRASTGVYYDGQTLIKAEENLLANSANIAASGWTAGNGVPGTIGPDIAINGSFDSASNWNLTNASISGGQLTIDNVAGARAEQGNALFETGGIFKIEVDIATNPGSFTFQVAKAGGWDTYKTFTGTGLQVFYMANASFASSPAYRFLSNNTGAVVINSITIKRITSTNATAPNGTATATLATAEATNAVFTQTRTVNAGDHTFSVWLKRVTGSGNVDISCNSAGTWVTQSGVVAASGWVRYAVTQTLAAGARFPGIRLTTSGDQVEVWGAQLEQRSFAAQYLPTTIDPAVNYMPQLMTAAINQPRFDHSPTTSESLGLLIEQSKTNLLTHSEAFEDAYWNKVAGSSIVVSSGIVPNGGTTVRTYIPPSGASTGGRLAQQTTRAAGLYTLSFYVKSAGINVFTSYLVDRVPTGLNLKVRFDLSAVTATIELSATGDTASITDVGNGWRRCVLSHTLPGTSAELEVRMIGETENIASNGLDGLQIWGAQLEASTDRYATSYIPTAGSTITRSADVATISGSTFLSVINPAFGTYYTESSRAFNAYSIVINGGDGSPDSFPLIGVRFEGDFANFSVVDKGDYTGRSPRIAFIPKAINKLALAYQDGNSRGACNGTLTASVTATVGKDGTMLKLGRDRNNTTTRYLDACIGRVMYWEAWFIDRILQGLTY